MKKSLRSTTFPPSRSKLPHYPRDPPENLFALRSRDQSICEFQPEVRLSRARFAQDEPSAFSSLFEDVRDRPLVHYFRRSWGPAGQVEPRPRLLEKQTSPEDWRERRRKRYSELPLAERNAQGRRIAAAVVKRWRKKGLP